MHEDDTCYYIGFTREEFSRVGGVESIHHSLQQMCATFAAYSFSAVGINPNDLNEKNELEMMSTPTLPSRIVSSASMASQHQQGSNQTDLGSEITVGDGQVRFFIPNQDNSSVDSVSISMQPHIHVNSPSLTPGDSLRRDHDKLSAASQLASEARRGLQLFRFHSGLDVHANPVVKLRCHSLEVCQETPPSTTSPTHTEQTFPHAWSSHVLESHHLLPRLSEASEERESSPLSEDTDNHDNDAPPTYDQAQNDVFEEATPRQLEEGRSDKHVPKSQKRRKPEPPKPLKLDKDAFSDFKPHPPHRRGGHHHHHHHSNFLKPHPPAYSRSLSEGVLPSGEPIPPSPSTHKGAGTPLYSSTLSLIVPEDEVKGQDSKPLAKSLSHEELSPREIPRHHHHSSAGHNFLELIRHLSVQSHSKHDLHGKHDSHGKHDLHSNHELHGNHEVRPNYNNYAINFVRTIGTCVFHDSELSVTLYMYRRSGNFQGMKKCVMSF